MSAAGMAAHHPHRRLLAARAQVVDDDLAAFTALAQIRSRPSISGPWPALACDLCSTCDEHHAAPPPRSRPRRAGAAWGSPLPTLESGRPRRSELVSSAAVIARSAPAPECWPEPGAAFLRAVRAEPWPSAGGSSAVPLDQVYARFRTVACQNVRMPSGAAIRDHRNGQVRFRAGSSEARVSRSDQVRNLGN